jgi:hypothetical protein
LNLGLLATLGKGLAAQKGGQLSTMKINQMRMTALERLKNSVANVKLKNLLMIKGKFLRNQFPTKNSLQGPHRTFDQHLLFLIGFIFQAAQVY